MVLEASDLEVPCSEEGLQEGHLEDQLVDHFLEDLGEANPKEEAFHRKDEEANPDLVKEVEARITQVQA